MFEFSMEVRKVAPKLSDQSNMDLLSRSDLVNKFLIYLSSMTVLERVTVSFLWELHVVRRTAQSNNQYSVWETKEKNRWEFDRNP